MYSDIRKKNSAKKEEERCFYKSSDDTKWKNEVKIDKQFSKNKLMVSEPKNRTMPSWVLALQRQHFASPSVREDYPPGCSANLLGLRSMQSFFFFSFSLVLEIAASVLEWILPVARPLQIFEIWFFFTSLSDFGQPLLLWILIKYHMF